MTRATGWTAAFAAAISMAACGGDAPSSPSSGGSATITITSIGVSPQSVTVSPGAQVTFLNRSNRPHDMTSDPHPDHTDCPEINQAGFIQPGNSRQTGNLTTVRTCGFHDHNDPDNASLRGTIRIQ